MERLTRRINGVVVYVGAKNSYSTGQIPCEVEPAGAREMMDRLAAYEDTRLTPEEIDMDHEAAEQLRQLCQGCDLDRLEELAEADKDGRLFILPLEPGRSMLYQQDFERPCVMKNVAPCIQYQSSAGIIFFMRYYTFSRLVENGRITPLLPEGEKTLEAMKDD